MEKVRGGGAITTTTRDERASREDFVSDGNCVEITGRGIGRVERSRCFDETAFARETDRATSVDDRRQLTRLETRRDRLARTVSTRESRAHRCNTARVLVATSSGEMDTRPSEWIGVAGLTKRAELGGGRIGLTGEELELGEHRDSASAFTLVFAIDEALERTACACRIARRERQLCMDERRDGTRRCRGALERFRKATTAHGDLDAQRGQGTATFLVEWHRGNVGLRGRATTRLGAERVEEGFGFARATRTSGERAMGQEHIGRAIPLTGREPMPHHFTDARDLIHRAERTVIARLPSETRTLRHGSGARNKLGGSGRQTLALVGLHLLKDIDAHDFMENDAAITDRIHKLTGNETGQRGFDIETRGKRGNRSGRDGLTKHRKRLHRGARRLVERGNRPRILTESAARKLATQTKGNATRTTKCGVETFNRTKLLFEARPEGLRRIDIETMELDFGDRRADGRRQRITPNDHDATKRGGPEQERRQQVRRFIDAQVLDVIDDEHARLSSERLRQASRHAAQCTLCTCTESGRTIPRMALDHGARRTERRRELADESRLA